MNEDMTKVAYQAKQESFHTVTVYYAGQEIKKYVVNVGPYKETSVVISGPGITNGEVGKPSVFKVKSTKGKLCRLPFYTHTNLLNEVLIIEMCLCFV